MSRKNNRPQFRESINNEPVNTEPMTGDQTENEVVVVEVFDPIEDTVEVGEVILVDGPLDSVPLTERTDNAEAYEAPHFTTESAPGFEKTPDFGAAPAAFAVTDSVKDKAQDAAQGVAQKAQDAGQKAQDVVQDVTQKTQDAAKGVADKAQDVAQSVVGKAQDVVQGVASKAQDVTQKVADKASTAKAAAGDALDSAKSAVPAAKGVLGNAASKIGTAGASGAQSVGATLWNLFQRNPLQAIFVIASLVWLFRNNKTAASQPPVSLNDAAGEAAEKVGTVAGHVQVAATNLGSQVSEQATRSAGWFSRTLYENPLSIGAMAIVFGAGLGFAVPESGYEHKLLGKTRDDLADKVQAAAQDLGHKVTAVAQTAVHEAVETVKTEAKNQGLSGELTPESAAQDFAKVAGKAQDALQNLTQKVTEAAADEAKNQGLTAETEGQAHSQTQGQPLAIDPPPTG